MDETQKPQPRQDFRWSLLNLLLWVALLLYGFWRPKDLEPVILGWVSLITGAIGAITKGVSIFVMRPIFILIEALNFLVVALFCGILFVQYFGDSEVLFVFGFVAVIAAIAATGLLRRYFGRESTLLIPIWARDFGFGFFGWIVFHNLLFVLAIAGIDRLEALSVHFDTFWLLLPIMWLPAIVAPIVFFVKKRIWISTGIVAAVILNTGIWIFLFPLGALVGFPFPLGALFFQQ